MSSKRAQEEKQLYNNIKNAFNATLAPTNLTAEILGNLARDVFIKGFRYTTKDIKARTPAIFQLCKLVKDKYAEFNEEQIDLSMATTMYCSGVQITGEHIAQLANTGTAFAIWVADILTEADKLDELNEILPDEFSYAGTIIFDINHSNGLIERIAYVCDEAEKDDDMLSVLAQIVELIPNEYITKGIERFDKLAWELLDICIKEFYDLSLQKEMLLRQLDLSLDFDRLNRMPVSMVDDDLKEKMSMAAQVDLLDLTTATMFSVFQNYYNGNFKIANSIKLVNKINELTIANPYEICAIHYILKLKNDFRFWAMGPFATAVSFAAKRLPWTCDLEYEEPHESTDLDNPELYNLKYNSSMFEAAKDKNGLLNVSQLIYHLSGGGIVPRNLNSFKSDRLILEKNGLPTNTIDFITITAAVLAELDKRNEYYGSMLDFDDEDEIEEQQKVEISDETISNIQNAINDVKDKIKKAQSENHLLEEQRRKVQKEYDELNRLYQQEHRELIDLRNYVFNQNDDAQEKIETADLQIEYPYTVKCNVVVFGGHETWSKAIKLLFTNVKFVNKDALPNPDMIKNADIVWIQPNSIGHSKYYKILDVVRTYHIPLRYFSYASAEKCAEQIVIEDMK